MTYSFRPRGICAQEIVVDVDDQGVIQDLRIVGGCDGNHKGLAALVKGMKAQDAMERLRGSPAVPAPPPARTSWPGAWSRSWPTAEGCG